MKTYEMIVPEKHINRPGIKLHGLKGIVWHYTANDNAAATDTMHGRYLARPYERGKYWSRYENKEKIGWIEAGSMGKGERGLGIAYRQASAHIFCDHDSRTLTIPLDEVAWSCGDRNRAGAPAIDKGQMTKARILFNGAQNYYTINVEICNNDVIKGSPVDWDAAVKNAYDWTRDFLRERGLKIDLQCSLELEPSREIEEGRVVLLRHYDLTGKICPEPLVKDGKAWENIVTKMTADLA